MTPVPGTRPVPGAAQLQARLAEVFAQGYEGEDGQLLLRHRLAMGFGFHDPQLAVIIDGRGEAVSVQFGATLEELSAGQAAPDISFLMDGETAHAFWLGELNVMLGLTRGVIRAQGSLIRALSVAPMLPHLQASYRQVWQRAAQ